MYLDTVTYVHTEHTHTHTVPSDAASFLWNLRVFTRCSTQQNRHVLSVTIYCACFELSLDDTATIVSLHNLLVSTSYYSSYIQYGIDCTASQLIGYIGSLGQLYIHVNLIRTLIGILGYNQSEDFNRCGFLSTF